MPMFQIMMAALAALLIVLAAAIPLKPLRTDLRSPLFWAVLTGSALLLSLASSLHGKTGHAGTGIITRYGWPKSFYYIIYPELGEALEGWEPIYFIGNTAVYGAVLLVGWAAWRALRR